MPGVFRKGWFPRRSRKFSAPALLLVNLTGVHVTTAVGSLSVSASSNEHITGVQATTAVGTLTPSISKGFNLTGVQATTAVGQLIATNPILLVGQAATSAHGNLALHIDTNIHLTGVAATSAVGLLRGDHPSVNLIGVNVTTSAGHLISNHPGINLIGVSATAQLNAPGKTITKPLSGVFATTHIPARPFFSSPNLGLSAVAAIAQFTGLTSEVKISVFLQGQRTTSAVGSLSLAGVPGSRTFIIAGINQITIAPGIVMFPTSENHSLPASNYVIASSQFYSIGQVQWNGEVKVEGVDWEYFAPADHPTAKHIVHILTPGTVSTAITLVFYQWNIGVRDGFEITAYPVPFGFAGDAIIAERVPPLNEYFTVSYTNPRPGQSPRSMFAIFPNMVDDMLIDHTSYDGSSGFQTFRPNTYKVFDETDVSVWEWVASAWVNLGPYSPGTYFYVKRLRQVYLWDGSTLTLVYTAGDGSSALPQVISYPLFGDSIAYNFLQDAFLPSAPTDFPSAYEVAISPGDYDPWVPNIDS